MIALNLTAADEGQQFLLAYLQENVSEILADKINNGVQVEVDGKQLINKKDLNGFMDFAQQEARNAAPKNARYAGLDGDTVAGWAIHYFEEDSIIGKLYTLDGKEVKSAPKKAAAPKKKAPAKPAQKQDAQMSLFGMFEDTKTETKPPMTEVEDEEELDEDEEELDTEVEQDEEPQPQEVKQEEPQGSPLYQCYRKFAAKYQDSLLFLRVGDFYEALGNHATQIADVLGLTLTGRDCGLKERVPMVGVPYHAFEVYVGKLIERGYKVAVAEDLTGFHFANEATQRIDRETGEVLPVEPQTEQDEDDDLADLDTSAFDSEAVALLYDRLGDEIELR